MDRSWWRVLKKHGPLEKVMANHFSILALRTPLTVKNQKDRTLKDELPRSVGAQYATGDLKLQYFGHLIQRADSFEKTLMLGKI